MNEIKIDEKEKAVENEINTYKNLIECKELDENYKRGNEFEKIKDKISNLLDKDFEIHLDINKKNIKTKNFIFTENAIKKLKEIKYYISHNYPVLLEGPTGTAKTKSVEILCEEMGLKLKRFNLSSETKTADLFGRYAGDPDSFSGISFQEGVFIEAFKNGYTLLLDEINLASNQVLQSFEECLDSHKISCEIPGIPWKEIEMGKGFNLIATQNPNKGLFANKRQDLGKKFLSRFHVINFDNFQKEELYQIAKGLGEKNKIDPKILKDLVNFHDEWSNLEERKNDILCFTVREIEATINAISKGENIKEAILIIYGSRYKTEEYNKLKKILSKYKYLNSDNNISKLEFNNEFLYISPLLENVLKAVKMSFDNNRHVMIIGDEGTGKSQIAKFIAEARDKLNDKNDDDGIYYCICTEDLKCSDLIGNQYPSINSSNDDNNTQQLMKWEDGFLTISIIKGKCCILDNIEEAPATITERLNGLLDKKLDIDKDLIFEIPECPLKKEVKINKNFRLLCICNYNSISKMSPAFLNRFDIITLEDQIKSISKFKNNENMFLELIDILMKQHSFNYYLSNENQNKKEDINKYIKYLGKDINDIQINTEENKKFEFKYEKDENLNKLIYQKIIYNIQHDNLSIYKLSLFCRAVYIFIQELPPSEEIKLDQLINYAYQLIISENIIDDPKIEDYIYNKYLTETSEVKTDNKYFFKESLKLRYFMAKLFASSMINLYICVIGRTGVGKTSCAREFSRIRKKSMDLSEDFYMHSFHSNTKTNHFYGNITMKNNEIKFINGSLLNAMEKGTTFIADEMNLSPEIVMKSLVPALDLNLNCKIFIPGIKKRIKINPKFFFIACQNDFTTAGRNSLPKILAKKLKCIYYPEPPMEDIQKICSNINLELYNIYDEEKKKILIKNGEYIAKYMNELNKLKLSYIPNWSIRDITKILKRIKFQSLEKNEYKYNNINFIDNIIFYTLSGIYKKYLKDEYTRKDLTNKLLDILKLIFPPENINSKDIEDIINKEAIITKDNEENFLKKGKCGISLKYIQFFNKNNTIFRLPSLFNDLFLILLAHDEEPILIIGESGYKTYLAQLILPDIKPIQLNSETTISQLLGSTIFLSDTEVKGFYLKQIYNILDIPINDKDINMVQRWAIYNERNDEILKKEQGELFKKINEEKYVNKKSIYEKFEFTINNLEQKLRSNNFTKKKNLNNINLEFNPGLILNSILSGKSLILKYLSNLPTVVLERFNELFSGKHNLTLNEDIHDTFTKEGNREFSNLGENFRIFATCSLGEQNKLSEAVLSRFTIIYSDKYKSEEEKDVLKSFLIDNELEFNQNCIDLVINFSKKIKNYSLSQMINALSLSNRKDIFKEDKNTTRINILSYILYQITYGLSYKIKINPNNKYDIEERLKSILPDLKLNRISGDDCDVEPLSEENKCIISKYNKLQIECGEGKKIKNEEINNIAFTKTFTEMVDYIHLGIATNTPVILEGGTGLGKQTAINYVAYKLNYKIINFIITQSTKIEDLLGRNQIIRKEDQIKVEFCETKILKLLVGKEGDNNIIIVFHNLNKASSALMESLISIFDKKQTNILRPDGKSEVKSKINLIGIINSQNNIAIKDKLPLSLINCVFYYILPKLSPKETKDIILKKFKAYDLMDEFEDFVNCFNKSREFSYTKGNISYFSLNDITKYILFRKHTKNYLDKYIILQIIFAYRFIQSDFIKDIINELGFLSMKINPIIKIRDESVSIYCKNKDIKNEIKVEYYIKNEINKNEILQKINTLNIKQKQCILFLALSILCKRACIIQGDTASGKTHLIRLFAEVLGQKLIIYQINKETGLSIFTGQSTLLDHLEEEEIKQIKNYFNLLSKKENLKNYINNEINDKKWTIKKFNILIQKIREYNKNNNENMEESEYKNFKYIADYLEDLIQPYKRFKKNESMFIKALKEGFWVLIDGIESANPVISDKLIGLCDDNPELDLTETGENIIFSKNYEKINPNFHLFINYNPLNKSDTNQLNEMFLNKCITFTLSPMDSDIESSAQILYGYMKNSNNINESLCKDISSMISHIHQEMNNKIMEKQDFFSGDVEFTGRIIKNIGKEISKSKDENDLCKHLVDAFYLNYINSVNNKNDINNIIEVKKIIKNNLQKICNFDTGEKDIYLKYSEILKILRNIQLISKKKIKEYDFNFLDFLNLLQQVEIGDLNLIYYYINETIKFLDDFVGDSFKNKINYFNYYNLEIIKKLIKNILDYVDNNKKYNILDYTLADKEELICKSILTKEIAKFNLVLMLESSFKQFKLSDSYIYLSKELLEYIGSIEILLKNNDIKDLCSNLKIINKIINLEININYFIQLFPFNQIILEKKDNNNKKIRMFKIIYLIYKIIEKKIDFKFEYDCDIIKFDFKKEDKKSFKNLFIQINLSKDFYIENCKLLIKNESEEMKIIDTTENLDNNDNEEIINVTNWFYVICLKILENRIEINNKSRILYIISDISNNKKRIIDEITEEYKKEIKEDNRTYRITKLISNPKNNLDIKEDNLIIKIWYLILFYEEEKLKLITPSFCLPFEKELLYGIKNIYLNIDIKNINKILSFTKKFIKLKFGIKDILYGNSNSFLYKIQSGFFDYSYIENKDKKDYCIQFENEIKWYKQISSPFDKFWSSEKSIQSLQNQYFNIKEYVEDIDKAEEYRNKINELIVIVNNYEFEGKEENKKNIKKIINLIQSKLTNPTKEVYETCQKNIDNYFKNLKEELSENQILFPFDINNDYNYNKDDDYVICLNILKIYSLQYKKLSDIFEKPNNILSEIFKLDKEIDCIIDILGKYVLENREYINLLKNQIMGILRSFILYKIIKYGKKKEKIESLFKIFLKLPELINAQIGGNINEYFNENILKFIKINNKLNIDDYLIIPNFEAKDFLYLFLIINKEEKNGEFRYILSKGFLFKDFKNEEIKSILLRTLNKYDEQDLNNKEKKEFKKYTELMGRSLFQAILPEKCDENFDGLSYKDLAIKLENELNELKNKNLKETNENKNPYDNESINEKIIENILNCFTLATVYEDNYKKIQFTYEDIDFFKKENWKNELMSKYPGMTFWLLKNYSIYKDLMKKKHNSRNFII